MGADIYIDSICNKARKEYEPKFNAAILDRNTSRDTTPAEKERLQNEVDKYYHLMFPENGYFHDSYNATSLFWQLDLSWWKDVGNLLPKKSSLLPVPKVKKLLAMVEARQVPSPNKLKRGLYLLLDHAPVDEGENSRENWHKHFVEKREQFIKFLNGAIKMKKPIRCSI